MYIRSLYLQQFRNYRDAYFPFNPYLNVICGPNAQGKTTVLEALYYLMTGHSFRASTHRELFQIGTTSFYLEAIFCKHEIDQKLRIYLHEKEREILYNSTPLPNATSLLGVIQGVIMSPDDVNLVKGPPLLRRQFLDLYLTRFDPLYVHYLTRYTKAMRHRNLLLKQKQMTSIESWEYEMARAAAYIVKQRAQAIAILQPHSQQFYVYLTDECESLDIRYHSEVNLDLNENEIREFYIKRFQHNRNKEILLGYTLSGPHKDDFSIDIGQRDARQYASEGQQRSCVIALHMGEWQCLKNTVNDPPILMIDDVGISLDDRRRQRLLDQLVSFGQVFLTTTDSRLADSFLSSKIVISLPLESSILSPTILQEQATI